MPTAQNRHTQVYSLDVPVGAKHDVTRRCCMYFYRPARVEWYACWGMME